MSALGYIAAGIIYGVAAGFMVVLFPTTNPIPVQVGIFAAFAYMAGGLSR